MDFIVSDDRNSLALFFELSDESVRDIEGNSSYCYNKDLMVKYLNETGDNCHIYHLVSRNGIKGYKKYFKELLNKYKTVSYWDYNMNKFRSWRGICHQQ